METRLPKVTTGSRLIRQVLALVAVWSLVLQPQLASAQTAPETPPAKTQPKPRPHARKAAPKPDPTDSMADELNRTEAEKAQASRGAPPPSPAPAPQVAPAQPPVAAPAAAPPPAAPPSRPLSTVSLTPETTVPPPAPPADRRLVQQPPVLAPTPTPTPAPAPSAPPLQQVQNQPPATPPSPVPIQPAPPGGRPPVVTGGAPARPFGQAQVIGAQAPTLTLEINKGTAIRLPSPAATVFVAAPDIADVQVKSPTMIYVFAKKPGDTVLYAVDEQDRVLLNTVVSVTSPISRMKGALDGLHPGNSVTIDNQGETIVLGGTVRSALIAEDARRLALQHVGGNAAKVISTIRVDAPTQVQLRVKIAEVRRDALKRVGINWQNIANFGQAALIGTVTGGFATATISGVGGAASGLARISTTNADALIDFLATQNQATVLAEPNLIAMSGETASFLAGGEIPIIAPQAGLTGSTFAINYKQVGVSLAFTPTIIGERINLKVAPEVSQLSASGSISVPLTATAVVTVPAIQTRRAATTVELASGQSFAIAGLLQQTSQQDITKLPWLGDIPILGTLFKSDAYQRSETELVIIITPYFVEPVSGRLRTPLTDRVPPTDADRILYQRMNHPTPPRRVGVGRENAGPSAGFKLD